MGVITMNETIQFIIGVAAISLLVGAYQLIYLLNNRLKSKFSEDRKREIERDIQMFGTCCGNTESCTLDAKISSLKKQVELALPETIVETKAGDTIEKVE
jgi:hypothetical protein